MRSEVWWFWNGRYVLLVMTGCAQPAVVNILCRPKELTGKEVDLVLRSFHLAGLEVAGVDEELPEGLTGVVRDIMVAMDAKELADWVQFGEMLLLLRERRMMEKARGEAEGESE